MEKLLNLEEDLVLTEDDFLAMKQRNLSNEHNLEDYLDFLDAVDAFESDPPPKKYYDAEFTL